MKRYTISNNVVDESDIGNWVNADVAQEMYEALEVAKGIMVNEQFYSAAKIMNDAIERADKGG